MEDWLAFESRFPRKPTDPNEKALIAYVNSSIIPGIKAAMEARQAERKKKEAAEKAAARKAAREARNEGKGGAAGEGSKPDGKSSRIAQAEADKRAGERIKYDEQQMANMSMTPGGIARSESEAAADRAAEVDRRALRAKQREEEKRQKGEADALRALRIANGEPPEPEEIKPPPPPAPTPAPVTMSTQVQELKPAVAPGTPGAVPQNGKCERACDRTPSGLSFTDLPSLQSPTWVHPQHSRCQLHSPFRLRPRARLPLLLLLLQPHLSGTSRHRSRKSLHQLSKKRTMTTTSTALSAGVEEPIW